MRQRLDLAVSADELGASPLRADTSETVVTDPDGNEFRLVVAHLTPP